MREEESPILHGASSHTGPPTDGGTIRSLHWAYRHSRILFAVCDAGLLAVAIGASAWLRFDGRVPPELLAELPGLVLLSVVVKITVFYFVRLYDLSWSHVGLEDMVLVVRAVTAASLAFWLASAVLRASAVLGIVPRAVILLDYVISLHLIGAFRMGRRVLEHLVLPPARGRVALIVGAGAAGEQLLRSLRQTQDSGYRPVGFIDDDPRKIGRFVHGLRVLGSHEALPQLIQSHGAEAVLIAMPSASSRAVRTVVSQSKHAGVQEIRIVPGIDRILNRQIGFTDLREIQLTDLLARGVAQIDAKQVEGWLRGRVVVVTGAAGSIGSELGRQILRFGPRGLVLLDCDESGLFWLEREVHLPGFRPTVVIADVRDRRRVRALLDQIRPDVVFHAAAYKHVGLMERFPDDAVLTNVFGTLSVAEASVEAGVEKFVLISTDKAVNPASVMGATKRVAEQICLALDGRGATRFVAVRFGNVLGSRGSVVPLFEEKIRRGEPITIRGPNMQRYFMAVSEAVLLVLQAGAMGAGSEIFVLDMGEPIKIVDLARDLVRLHGLEPERDVPLIFTDPEPGEKDCEDLLTAEEGTVATRQDRIFVARTKLPASPDPVFAHLDALRGAADARDPVEIIRVLQRLVPTYRPSEFLMGKASADAAIGRMPVGLNGGGDSANAS